MARWEADRPRGDSIPDVDEAARQARGTDAAKEAAAVAAGELDARCGADGFDVAVVLGSGWSGAADSLGAADAEFDAAELPGFAVPAALGHSSRIRCMWVGDKRVAVFMGRVHLYEGHDAVQVAHTVRTGIAAGAHTVVLTSSAASLRTDFTVGLPVVVRDHINLTSASPLVGPGFVDLDRAYSPRLRRLVLEVDASLPEGVYAAVGGPHFQTPAELKMLRQAGADLVGRSIALETIAAVEMGAQVLALAMVTNDALGAVFEPFNPLQALGVTERRSLLLGELLGSVISSV